MMPNDDYRIKELTQWSLGDVVVILNLYYTNISEGYVYLAFPV